MSKVSKCFKLGSRYQSNLHLCSLRYCPQPKTSCPFYRVHQHLFKTGEGKASVQAMCHCTITRIGDTTLITNLTASDGHKFSCWIDKPEGESRGGIVILQEIFGVTDQLKSVAKRYSDLGYTVAIPALFDRQQRDAVVPFDAALPGRDMMLAAKLDQTMSDVEATIAALDGKVAVLGFCWGGGLAIRAAQTLNIAAVVAFYGTRLPQYLDMPLKVPVLGHYGTKDDHVPAEMLKQATDYFPDIEIHLYETGHAFANDARPGFYHKESSELAHQRTEVFLEANLR